MNSREGPQRRSWVPTWLHTCVPTCSLNYTPDLDNFLKWVTLKKETQALQPGVNPAAPSSGWPRGHIVPAQLGHHLWGAGSSPGVSQGSCYCLLFSIQSCPALCDPMDCSPPGSSVHGISQARILEWVAISSSRGASSPRD